MIARPRKPNIKLIRNFRLTTAEILYHLPDYPSLLQTFVWQNYDTAPKFPRLNRFLGYWEEHIEGKLHSVKVASRELNGFNEIRIAESQLRLH